MEDFIGKSFTKLIGGATHTVVGSLPRVKGRETIYQYTCSVCSEDKELFPEYFTSRSFEIKKGIAGCGCGRCKWSEKQYKVKLQRKLKSDLEFIKFFDWKGNNTFCEVYCKVCDLTWDTSRLSSLLLGSGCTSCANENNRQNLSMTESSSRSELSKVIPEKYQLKEYRKDIGKPSYWFFDCSVCKADHYSSEGGLSYTFKDSHYHLLKGRTNCRCSKQHQYTEAEYSWRVKRHLSLKNGKFKESVGGFGDDGRVIWVCGSCSYTQEHAAPLVFNGNYACYHCRMTRPMPVVGRAADEADNLYLVTLKNQITLEKVVKIGRSFKPYMRFREYGNYEVTSVEKIVEGTHADVVSYESEIKKEYIRRRVEVLEPFGGSSFEVFPIETLDCLKATFDRIEVLIHEKSK